MVCFSFKASMLFVVVVVMASEIIHTGRRISQLSAVLSRFPGHSGPGSGVMFPRATSLPGDLRRDFVFLTKCVSLSCEIICS